MVFHAAVAVWRAGLERVMGLYSPGFQLVRFLRPLAQVLAAQVDEGNEAVRYL
jgi:hypothetical protein